MLMKRPEKILHVITNKYLITFLIFIVWMVFLDNHNFMFVGKNMKKLKTLKTEKEYFKDKIETENQKIEELQSSSENLEKFAREQFLMKKENEDIFVIIEE